MSCLCQICQLSIVQALKVEVIGTCTECSVYVSHTAIDDILTGVVRKCVHAVGHTSVQNVVNAGKFTRWYMWLSDVTRKVNKGTGVM
jgi:hypothetical protein